MGSNDAVIGNTDAVIGNTDAVIGNTDAVIGSTEGLTGNTDVIRTGADAGIGTGEVPAVDAALLSYGTYLRLDELLAAQHPLTDHHDELLFVVIHQVYELWFKQILHEAARMQDRLEAADEAGALHIARRIAKILKTIVGQLDVLETMTPRQFSAFRPELGTASGFQSHQFRVLEAVLGRRDFVDVADPQLSAAITRPPVFDSLLRYLSKTGYDIPDAVFERDPREPWHSDPDVAAVLLQVYKDDTTAAEEVCEALVDIDEGIQEWRYRHVMMVERIIGAKMGTGGSSGADYLRSTLFHPAFPDLWEVRSNV
jgi:tryptophan 2,3-dioxygenase